MTARLEIKVSPKAARTAVAGWHGNALKIAVTAAPERGKANRAVLDLLARALGVPRSTLRIARGGASPHKLVEIEGLDDATVKRRLDDLLLS
ncbi:MAG: DUF167 domain-containing protein [Myxococcota bacterium]